MNFLDLMTKLQAIEEGNDQNAMRRPMAQQSVERMAAAKKAETPQVAPTKDDQPSSDESIEECGVMMGGTGQGQQDNVNMNVNMSGSGAGGIRDLLAVLKNLDQVGDTPSHKHGNADMIVGDSYENSVEGGSEAEVYGTDAVTTTGDDMNSKGLERSKVNGGGNPMQEALVSKLAQMYEEIKANK